MKKRFNIFLIIFLLITGQAFAGETNAIPKLVEGNNDFAFDMYKEIYLSDKDKNIFFSPLSISTALGMTYAGAKGNTEIQMADVLHFQLPQDELHAAFSMLSDQLKEKDGYKLAIANALWGQKDYHFQNNFLKIAGQYYKGGFNTVDFSGNKEESRQTINQWIEKNTENKIKDLLQPDDLNSMTRLILTNAIYFKGDWVSKFKETQTKVASFYTQPEKAVNTPMMHQIGDFGYASTEEAQLLEMPYIGNDLSMVFILPEEENKDFNVKITPTKLKQWLSRLEEQKVDVTIPKFKFEARYSLGKTLSELGMEDAFELPPADFSGITGGKNLYIKDAIHKAVIEVNEDGSEAAAATAVIMNTKSVMLPASKFKADRPFIFLIKHKSTGSILFMGRVANPSTSAGETSSTDDTQNCQGDDVELSDLINQNNDGGMIYKKPIIYLYPKKKTDINIRLDFDGKLECTYPEYENGWNVTAFPDGRLINHNDMQEYNYLFWEGTNNYKWEVDSGFVVKGEETAGFLREKLRIIGLSAKETNDFIVYWLPLMKNNPYNLIYFAGKEYAEMAKLEINPKPDSMLRVFMIFKKLEEPIEIKEQKLDKIQRKGFAVVEWGGLEAK